MTFHDSRVGKLGKVSNSRPVAPPSATTGWKVMPPWVAVAGPITCWWWWSSKNSDVSRVGKQPSNRFPGLLGSGFKIGFTGSCELPNLTPVTCCTIWRKLAGSAVMKVVWDRFDARDFRLVIFPPAAPGIAVRRFGAVSWSDPETPETLGVWAVSGLRRSFRKGEIVSHATLSGWFEIDFWRALVRVSVSRANASDIQESAKVWRNTQGSTLAKLSDDAILTLVLSSSFYRDRAQTEKESTIRMLESSTHFQNLDYPNFILNTPKLFSKTQKPHQDTKLPKNWSADEKRAKK